MLPEQETVKPSEVGYIVDCRNGPSDYAFFWRPNGAGYTSDLSQAGLYTLEEYEKMLGSRCAQMAFVPQGLAESLVRPMVRFEDLHERGIRRESWRRAELKAERVGTAFRAVFA